MKILFFGNILRYFLDHRSNLVAPLIKAGHEVALICGECTPDEIARMPPGLRLVPIDIGRHTLELRRDFRAIRQFHAEVRDWKPDVVHAFTIKPNLFSAITLSWVRLNGARPPRLVITFPGLGRVFEDTGTAAVLRRFLVGTAMRLCLRSLDYTSTFENAADQERMITLKVVGKRHSHVICGAGIDLNEFSPSEERRSGRLTVLLASRLLDGKGIGEYCDAANALRHEGADLRFLLAGPTDPGYPNNFDIEQARESGRLDAVEYLGLVPADRMTELLRSVDIACLPSRLQEGFPRFLIEAAACGCALVGTNQPAIAQIISPGQTGWLVPAADPIALANALRDACENPDHARALGRNAARLVRHSGLGNEDVINSFVSLYGPK